MAIDAATLTLILDDVAGGISAARAMRTHGVANCEFYKLLARDNDAAEAYARAKEHGCAKLADEIVEIADEQERGIAVTTTTGLVTKDGEPRPPEVRTVEADMLEHRRLRIEARKWTLAKLMPAKYGDKIEHRHGLTGDFAATLVKARERSRAAENG